MELAGLARKGRIELRSPPEMFFKELEARFAIQPITGRICAAAMKLPEKYPKDPMDRIIGATAIVEGMSLVTADTQIKNSGAVPVVW